MRLLELYLKAFGCFTERRIELPDLGGPGLCILYGANEAGKTTALRAIRGLIYGIHRRSPDDFVHRYSDLRIGARMRFSDGEELSVMRRKKDRDSLYRYDDTAVLESDRMDRLVEAVPELLFERFYGLDHRSLSEGSAALLEDDGEVGRALFGASLGLANLGGVLDGLESEASELFAARANTRRINRAIAEWKDGQKEIRSLVLDPKDWEAQERIVLDGEEGLALLTQEIEDTRTELSRLERVKRALPAVARRRSAAARLADLVDVAELPEDFERRLTDARALREAAREAQRRSAAKIAREESARGALRLAPELIAERERIESVHQQVKGITKALEDLPRRESEIAQLDRGIEELLGGSMDVSRERVISLRATVGRAGLIRSLASESAKFEDRRTATREEVAEARADLERLRAEERDSEPLAIDVRPLQRSLAQAARHGTIDDRILAHEHSLSALDLELQQTVRRLGFESQGNERIEETSFPTHELIDSIAQRLTEQSARRESLGDERRKLREEHARIDEELSTIRIQGAVPRPEELAERRRGRDQVWHEIRRTLVERETLPDPDGAHALALRFERESVGADDLADRLRTDAKRVADEGSHTARQNRLDRDLAQVGQRIEDLEAERAESAANWSALWEGTGVEARAPEVMRGWRRELDDLRGLLAQRREAARAADRDELARREAVASVRAALSPFLGTLSPGTPSPGTPSPGTPSPGTPSSGGERLDGWTAEAESSLERQVEVDAIRRSRGEAIERASERMGRAARQADQAAAALKKWETSWVEAVAALEMEPGSRPEQALERIERMAGLLERLRERAQLADRVEKMGRDIAAFEASVADLVAKCAPDLRDHPPAPTTLRLQRMLGESLNQEVLHRKCVEALAEAREDFAEAEARQQDSAQVLDVLRGLAGVGVEGDLDEAFLRWRQVEDARNVLGRAESELENLAEGRLVSELEAQSAGADPDLLAARIATLDQENRARTEEQAGAISELRSQRDRLETMNGSARVADLADAAESRLAGIGLDVERYVQLRMAKQILEREIERYRNDHQAPLLKRSSEIFGALTRGAYPRMTSQVGDDGASAHLIAVSASCAEVAVEGLSSGTRDQLFMSLRLASLEESFARGESMPLIADDILIEFDDERTRATLEVLAEMGQKNQILLFSHHRHVVEIARKFIDDAAVIEL